MDTRIKEKHLKHLKNCILAPILFGKQMHYSSKVTIHFVMWHEMHTNCQIFAFSFVVVYVYNQFDIILSFLIISSEHQMVTGFEINTKNKL